MILRAGLVAGRAIAIRRGRKNTLKHFDQLNYVHYKPGLLCEFTRDTLF